MTIKLSTCSFIRPQAHQLAIEGEVDNALVSNLSSKRTLALLKPRSEEARKRGSEEARKRGSEEARKRGSEEARKRGSEEARKRE
ncbi:hypothetical protein D8T27_20055 [Vibrio vulnificus]|nr:hypothetical protein D8T27_20055 [Vibrio vulnificus]